MPSWSQQRITLTGTPAMPSPWSRGRAPPWPSPAFVLAEQLHRAHSIEAGLKAYEQKWRPVIEEKQRAARSLTRWFLPTPPQRCG